MGIVEAVDRTGWRKCLRGMEGVLSTDFLFVGAAIIYVVWIDEINGWDVFPKFQVGVWQ